MYCALLDKNNIIKFMLQPVHSIQSHFTISAQYPITCSKSHTLPAKNCESPRCVCTFYRPAHHMNWTQVLTPTLNITKYHMYMSTVVPAEVKCYITQWYCCTPEGIPWIGTRYYVGTLPKFLWYLDQSGISWIGTRYYVGTLPKFLWYLDQSPLPKKHISVLKNTNNNNNNNNYNNNNYYCYYYY